MDGFSPVIKIAGNKGTKSPFGDFMIGLHERMGLKSAQADFAPLLPAT
ncbi:MAG: hypothetical protein KY468_17650 [Armatimonadetes bacterium]|nr:hypothetical protein [Armatimonadota bacterium]